LKFTGRAIGAAFQVSVSTACQHKSPYVCADSTFCVEFGNLGSIIATYSFLKTDAPAFRTGSRICIGFLCLAFLSCLAYCAACVSVNRKTRRQETGGGMSTSAGKERHLML
jgi:hypothetical protein